jgi:hypothetical protein
LKEILQRHGIDITSPDLLGRNQEGVYCVVVPYVQALNTWKTLRALVELTGYWPVILTTEHEMNAIVEQVAQYGPEFLGEARDGKKSLSARDIIELASKVDVAAWVNRAIQQEREGALYSGGQFDFRHSAWLEDSSAHSAGEIILPWYQDNRPAPRVVVIGLCPTVHPGKYRHSLRLGRSMTVRTQMST